MAGQGQQQMKQKQLRQLRLLNYALFNACGDDNDQAHAEELLGRGADPNALVNGNWNALHGAAINGREQIVAMLLSRGTVLEARTFDGSTALLLAAFFDKPEVCLLLIAKGADLRVRSIKYNNYNRSALSHYGVYVHHRFDPSVKAQRVAELKAAFRAGCHPSQVQRRKDENWAKRWPLMNAATGSGFLRRRPSSRPRPCPRTPSSPTSRRRRRSSVAPCGTARCWAISVWYGASRASSRTRSEARRRRTSRGREQRRLFVCEKRE